MRVRVRDVRLFTTVRGDGQPGDGRPTVVGLHGGPGQDGGQIRFFLEPVTEYARVVVPDQRGNGRSDRSTPEHWNLETWADDIAELIDVLGLVDVVLVGTSFGGFVAQTVAARHSGLLAGVVVVGASPRKPSDDEIVERFRQLGGDRAGEVMARSLHDTSPEAERDWRDVCAPLLTRRPASEELLVVRRGLIQSPEVNAHFMEGFDDVDLRPGLATMTCPMLMMVGALDPLVPAAVAAEAVSAAPDGLARIVEVPEAGHQVFWDAPEHSYSLLEEFIRSCTGADAPDVPIDQR